MLAALLAFLALRPLPEAAVLTAIGPADAWESVVQAAAAVGRGPVLRAEGRDAVRAALARARPRYLIVVAKPETVDLNWAYDLAEAAAAVDADPFSDVAYGVITGRTPEAALRQLAASYAAALVPASVPRSILEVGGPNQLPGQRVLFWGRPMMLPPVPGFRQQSLNHGRDGFDDARLGDLGGFGLVHLGGHGVPERVEQGLTAAQIGRVALGGAVVFSGACWTGVTRRAFEWGPGKIVERAVEDSFCLAVLDGAPAAYLAAVHPDHGMPVYQEVERLLVTGEALGDVMRATDAGIVLASGGRRPALPRWRAGEAPPSLGRGTMEIHGTAARLLFGDPRLAPFPPLLDPPWEVAVAATEGGLSVEATTRNRRLRAVFTDTYHGDLAPDPMLFNDRVLVLVPLPPGAAVGAVALDAVRRDDADVPARLVGHAVEEIDGRRVLHLQADVATTGFQRSELRRAGFRARFTVRF